MWVITTTQIFQKILHNLQLLFYFRAPRWRSFLARYPTIELLPPARCGRIVPKKDATKLRLFLIVDVRDVPKVIFICGITCAG